MVAMLSAPHAERRHRGFRIVPLFVALLLAVQPLGAIEVTPEVATTCGKRIQGDVALRVGAELKAGNTVIVMRHAQAIDAEGNALDKPLDCKEPWRYVNSPGKGQLDKILSALGAQSCLRFRVLFSPMCRTEQTAKYLFGYFVTRDDDRLELGAATASLTNFLSPRDPEANLVLVTHEKNVLDLTGPRQEGISEAMAVVFSKSKRTAAELGECLGYLLPEDWVGLFPAERPAP